jgi:hypothetical protein
MELKENLQKLIQRARQECAPRVDVSDEVLATLYAGQAQSVLMSEGPFIWLAALSSTVAVSVVVLGLIMYYRWADPLAEVAQSIAWVMP